MVVLCSFPLGWGFRFDRAVRFGVCSGRGLRGLAFVIFGRFGFYVGFGGVLAGGFWGCAAVYY